MTIQIEKIVLTIGKKQIELSVEEAKELQRVLADTFAPKTTIITYPAYPIPYWVYQPYAHWTVSTHTYSGSSDGVAYLTTTNTQTAP